jgi:hypothetical protein
MDPETLHRIVDALAAATLLDTFTPDEAAAQRECCEAAARDAWRPGMTEAEWTEAACDLALRDPAY